MWTKKINLKKKCLAMLILAVFFFNMIHPSQTVISNEILDTPISDQEDFTPIQFGEWTQNFGIIQDITYRDGMLYLVGGNKELFIVDVSDLHNPITLGSSHNNMFARESILVEDFLIIALKQDGIDILNVENATNPELKNHFQTEGIISDFEINNEYMYIIKEELAIEIVNITNIAEPTEVNTLSNGDTVKEIVCQNDLLFVVGGENGLEIYNITEGDNPIKVGNYTDGEKYDNIEIINNYAFLNNNSQILKVLDVSNITNIQKVDELSIVKPDNIVTNDNNSLLLIQDEKIILMNCTNPSNIQEITNYNASSEILSIEINKGTIFLGCKEGIEIVELNSTKKYEFINRFGYGEINEIMLSDNYLYVTMGSEGLTILNATDPTALKTLSTYQANGSIVDVCKKENILFVLIENIGVEFIDIQNIENPIKIGEYLPEAKARCFALNDNYLFLGNYIGGEQESGEFLVLDISNINQPQVIERYEEMYAIYTKVGISDEYVYVLTERTGIRGYIYSKIFNYAVSFSPNFVINGPGYSDAGAIGEIFYTCIDGDLKTFDTNDTNNVKQISWIINGTYFGLYLENDYLYTRGLSTINIFALQEKDTIMKLEYRINNTILRDIMVDENYIVIANTGVGDDIMLFNHTLPEIIIEPKNPIWPYIVGPIGGVLVIGATVFGVIVIQKKKTPEIQPEN